MTAAKDKTNYARVNELLSYNSRTGILKWKIARSRWHVPGSVAGHLTYWGYSTIMVDGKSYYAHRLAWLLHTGKWPKNQIDHINRVRDDNRIENLREATKSQNQINSGMYRNNKSGYRGVHFSKAANKWVAEIKRDGVIRHLGVFVTAKEASNKFMEAANASIR